MQAVILAGGRGERLRPLTDNIPKPMVPVLGTPFLEVQVKYLASHGFRDIVLLTGYLGQQIEGHFGDGSAFGARIEYSHEQEPLGTGGCLRLAKDLIKGPFLMTNGDSFLPMDYQGMAAAFLSDGLPRIAVYPNLEGLAPDNLRVNGNQIIDCCHTGPEMNRIHAGVRALPRDVLDAIPAGFVSIEDSVYKPLLARGRLFSFEVAERFYDIGTPERLHTFEDAARRHGWVRELKASDGEAAIFLDRDGTVCVRRDDHVRSWDEFLWLPGAQRAVAELSGTGLPVFFVTNQSAINRGMTTREAVDDTHRRMIAGLAEQGGKVEGVYYCPHRPDEGCSCRKPETGLLLRAALEHHLNLSASFVVGDAWSDVAMGKKVGATTVLLTTEKPYDDYLSSDRGTLWPPDYVASDLAQAALIIKRLLSARRGQAEP